MLDENDVFGITTASMLELFFDSKGYDDVKNPTFYVLGLVRLRLSSNKTALSARTRRTRSAHAW